MAPAHRSDHGGEAQQRDHGEGEAEHDAGQRLREQHLGDDLRRDDAAAATHVGTNGETATGLVGGVETVAAHIRAFHATGVQRLMPQVQPFGAEMRRFAE